MIANSEHYFYNNNPEVVYTPLCTVGYIYSILI